MRLEWDEAKDLANQKKHGVSFQDASEVFVEDVDRLEIFDADHSDREERFITIGPIRRGLVLVVGRSGTKTGFASSQPAGRRHARLVSIEPTWRNTDER